MTKTQKINLLNKDFYKIISTDFDDSRQYSWQGWQKLVDRLSYQFSSSNGSKRDIQANKTESKVKVLDLGCGNARFYDFLLNKKMNSDYVGIDSSTELLSLALQRISTEKHTGFQLISADLLQDLWVRDLDKQVDLVVLFGVMHHLSDLQSRVNLFEKVNKFIDKNGIFVFTTWQFMDNPRLVKKVLNLQSQKGKSLLSKYKLTSFDFEKGDYILDWQRGKEASRFCHYYQEIEILNLLKEAEFELLDTFLADGNDGQTNKYWVCREV